MKKTFVLSSSQKLTSLALVVAAAGVLLQIVSGAPYPKIPPVFFILLVPALLIAVGKRRWTLIIAIVAGLFLTFGLFSSGAYTRLVTPTQLGDTIGLWIQTLAVIVAVIAGVIAFARPRRAPLNN